MILTLTQNDTHKNQQAHKLCVGLLPSFAGDDVPLFGCAHNDLGLSNLLAGQLVVPGQLSHADLVGCKALRRGIIM